MKTHTFTNFAGQTLLSAFEPDGNSIIGDAPQWVTYNERDDDGRVILSAAPSAVASFDKSEADLAVDVHDDAGLVQRFVYVTEEPDTEDAATASQAGDIKGYLKEVLIQQGDGGGSADSAIRQQSLQYFLFDLDENIAKLANETVYREENTWSSGAAAGAITTSYSYSNWATALPGQIVTTLPPVDTAQNGSGVAAMLTDYFDEYGRRLAHDDADGYSHVWDYDDATGALVGELIDSGGLGLFTQIKVDQFGRPIEIVGPAQNRTAYFYNDSDAYSATTVLAPEGPAATRWFDRRAGVAYAFTESGGQIHSMSRQKLDLAGRAVVDDRFVWTNTLQLSVDAGSQMLVLSDEALIDQAANATAPDNARPYFHRSDVAYDAYGRAHQVTNAVGTITNTEFDDAGRPKETWVGTSDGNLRIVESIYYDGDDDHEFAAAEVGDGNVTRTIAHPSGTAAGTNDHKNRVTDLTYDWRNRVVFTQHKEGINDNYAPVATAPSSFYIYDNLDQVTDAYLLNATVAMPTGLPINPNDVRGLTSNLYDDLGRVYESRAWSVEPQYDSAGNITAVTVPGDYLATQMWYDNRNNVVKQRAPGGLVTKVQYDGAGRAVKQFLTDGGGDLTHADAGNVTADRVVEQTETTYDANGNAIFMVSSQRRHDAGGATGALGAGTARISYVANWFDRLNRVKSTVNFGTYGGAHPGNPANPTDPRPPLPPRTNADGWDEYLVTDYAYNAAGHLELITDPRGIKTKREYDALARVTKLIEAYTNGVPTSSTNRTIEYKYNGNDAVTEQTQLLVSGGDVMTSFNYGVTLADGSLVFNNDLLEIMSHGTKPTPGSSTRDGTRETYRYNALGERISEETAGFSNSPSSSSETDQYTHHYTFDGVGRQIKDSVRDASNNLHLHSSYDATIDTLTVEYDSFGRAAKFTSIGSGVIRNEVARQYNGFGQVAEEWQRHYGDANPTQSLKVQYTYSDADKGSRLNSIIYPTFNGSTGRTVTFGYGTSDSLDDKIGRVVSLSDSVVSGPVETYAYLGLSSLVEARRPETNIHLILHNEYAYGDEATRPDGTTIDGGDEYTGLDRFGRVIDQMWVNLNAGAESFYADRFQYAYDGDSNRLYKRNMAEEWLEDFSELYSHNTAGSGYDLLNRLMVYQVGKLADPPENQRYGQIENDTRMLRTSWLLDEQGRWKNVLREAAPLVPLPVVDGPPKDSEYNGAGTLVGSNALGNPNRVTDAWNRLVLSRKPSSTPGDYTQETYAYDALGRMITESWSAGSTSFIRDFYHSTSWQTLVEWTQQFPASGQATQTIKDNVWSLAYIDAMVMQATRDLAQSGTDIERIYPLFDANFNVTATLRKNAGGVWEVSERFVYDPYGIVYLVADTAGGAQGLAMPYARYGLFPKWSYLFQGGYHPLGFGRDGLYHFRHRSYDPVIGQWLQRDPAGFVDGMNLHEYLGGNPVNRVDPTGTIAFIPLLIVMGIGAAIGGGAYTYNVGTNSGTESFSFGNVGENFNGWDAAKWAAGGAVAAGAAYLTGGAALSWLAPTSTVALATPAVPLYASMISAGVGFATYSFLDDAFAQERQYGLGGVDWGHSLQAGGEGFAYGAAFGGAMHVTARGVQWGVGRYDAWRAGRSAPVPRRGPRGVNPVHHNANVQIRDAKGMLRHHERLVSGNMTVEEQLLGFPRSMLATHTEVRAARLLPLHQGETMVITGQYPPCPSCKGALNNLSANSRATVIYRWREDGRTYRWYAERRAY